MAWIVLREWEEEDEVSELGSALRKPRWPKEMGPVAGGARRDGDVED